MKYWKIRVAVWLIIVFSGLIACTRQAEQQKASMDEVKPKFIQPPLPQIDLAYTEFELEAEKGGKFTYSSGTEIEIPANALLDQSGKAIKGKVKLQYREFHDAWDVFLSGIPMAYDSAGVKQNFQTAGMFDIKALQNNQSLQLAKGQKVKVKMASFQSDTNYNFYALDTLKKNWEFKTVGKTEINQEKLKLKQSINQMKPSPLSDWLILNYGQAVDVAFNDDWKVVEKNLPIFKNKLKAYGVEYWNDIRALDEIIYQGNKYPAYMMVWKKLENTPIPDWVKKGNDIRNIYDKYNQKTKQYELSNWVKMIPLGNGIYQLSIKHEGKYFNMKMTPAMRIASLLQNTPDYWKNQYEAAMAKVKIEEEKISQIAEVFRPIEVSNFGIYNYDRILNEPEAVLVKADFQVISKEVKPNLVYYISQKSRGVIPYNVNKWESVALVPDSTARVFAILPDYTLAYYKPEDYAKIDFKKLKSQVEQKEKPNFNFQLTTYPDLLKSKADVKKALGFGG